MNVRDAKRLAAAVGWALTLGVALSVQAQAVRTVQAALLRNEPAPNAPTLIALQADVTVNLLQLSGGWAQVRTQGPGGRVHGWLRASALDLSPPEVALASQIETGRRAGANAAVTLGSRSLPPRSNRHALLIGIGSYRADANRPVEALDGVDQDMASALLMARALQVPDENIVLLRDEAATSGRIAAAIGQLGESILPGDRVFIYWSGRGSRLPDEGEDACVESLVPYDLVDVTNRQFARWFKAIAEKADKMLVVYDAGHSGGAAASRNSEGSTGAALQAKFTPGPAACQTPGKNRSRSLVVEATAMGLVSQDMAHISSSRPDEISLQSPTQGGLATHALRQCLLRDARDADGSGSVSVQELADCAQAKLDWLLAGTNTLRPPHIMLEGNVDFVPASFAEAVPSDANAVSAAAATPVPMSRVLEQIYDQRDGKRKVTVTMAADRMRIGVDALHFDITSSHAGYVYVALLGSDQHTLYLLFPNRLDAQNTIDAGEKISLPHVKWQVTAGGPPGTDKLLVLVTDGPRDLPALRGRTAGPFLLPLTDATGRSHLQRLFVTNSRQRNAGACVDSACSDAFGAALVNIDEF